MIDDFGIWISRAFDLALRPFLVLGAMPSLLAVSALAGLALLLVFRRFSDQRGIRVARDRVAADLIALSLYRAAPGVFPRILAGLAVRTIASLRLYLRPLLVLALPLLVLYFQLDGRYACRPLRVGEAALVSATVGDPGGLHAAGGIALHGGPGVSVETPPVRIGAQRRAVWRVRATAAGDHEVRVAYKGAEVSKRIVVGASRSILSGARTADGFLERLLRAGEPPIAASAGIESVSVAYPGLALGVFGLRLPWLAWFLLVSAATAVALKGLLRVTL